MIKEYYLQNKIAISHPIFIAITALARLIILQRKDFDPEILVYEASAILILSLSILDIFKLNDAVLKCSLLEVSLNSINCCGSFPYATFLIYH